MSDQDEVKPYHSRNVAPGQEAADVVAEVLQHAQEREQAAQQGQRAQSLSQMSQASRRIAEARDQHRRGNPDGEQTAADVPFRKKEREPRVLLWAFGSSSVDYDVSIWIEDPWHAHDARSKFQEHIWRAFKEAGIVIAFPQLDVHLDKRVEEAFTRLSWER